MNTYVILRRNGWATPDDAQAAGARSSAEGDKMSDDIRWIRSYVLAEADGSIGTVCIYQATSEQALRDHTTRADLHLDDIVEVADVVIVRPDPTPVGGIS
jgi:thiamine biosynthesis protein ThiC